MTQLVNFHTNVHKIMDYAKKKLSVFNEKEYVNIREIVTFLTRSCFNKM